MKFSKEINEKDKKINEIFLCPSPSFSSFFFIIILHKIYRTFKKRLFFFLYEFCITLSLLSLSNDCIFFLCNYRFDWVVSTIFRIVLNELKTSSKKRAVLVSLSFFQLVQKILMLFFMYMVMNRINCFIFCYRFPVMA